MKIFKEPLLHFVLVGLLLFVVFRLMKPPAADQRDQIVVSNELIEHLEANFARTWQRLPEDSELVGLISETIRDEVAYREALKLGLDREDSIVRRRMRQKLEFLYEDALAAREVTEEELEAYLQENAEDYAFDPEIALLQIYINPERHEALAAYAEELLERLRDMDSLPDAPASLSDGLMLPSEIELAPLWQIKRSFGTEFANALIEFEPDAWEGPIVSGYGLHLVYVLEKKTGRNAELEAVRDSVVRDWTMQRKETSLDQLYQEMTDRYEIVFDDDELAGILDE